MNKLAIILVMIIGLSVYIQCENNDYSSKSAMQKITDSLNRISTENEDIILDKGSKTITNFNLKNISNIQAAYTGEIIATAKYKDFSRNAELEGLHHIALLYKAVSFSESIHANNHEAVLIAAKAEVPKVKIEFEINSTKQNLENDIKGEAYEATTTYPGYIKTAEAAGNKMAVVSLTYAMKTEKMHNIYLKIALEHLLNKTEKILPKIFYVCPTCGNTFENNAPDRCEFSLTKADKFIKIKSYK